MSAEIVRAGTHVDGRALVYCGGGCGETLRLGEGDIAARLNVGWGAPVCPYCKMCAQMENLSQALLGDVESALHRALSKLAKDMERHNYPDKQNPWGYE